MPALDRAIPLAEVDAVPVAVEQDLDLDVAGALDEAFDPARALRNLDVVFDRLAKLEVEGS